jgi:rhamnulokinase
MGTRNYLAVDLGAESGRTVVGRFDGKRIQLEETYRFTNGGVRVLDTLYWDVLRLWQEIKHGITQSVKSAGPPSSIGVDTWGVDFGLLGSDGELVGNPVHYRDRRTDGMMERAFARLSKSDIYQVTGLQFMKFNSLFQLLAVKELAKRDPFGNVDRLLFMPDVFNYFLTGKAVTEYTIASTSQILDARTRQWSSHVMDRLGLPTRILPSMAPTASRLGRLRPDVGDETGARGSEVVVTAGHDTAAAVAAVPAVGDTWCYISSGTWSLMGAELTAPVISDKTLASNFTNEGGVADTIRFLKNIMGLWLVQECRRSFARAGRSYDYATLTRLAAQAPSFGPIVDPDHSSFIRPDDIAVAVREFCSRTDQQPPESDGGVIRSCLESLALRYRWVLEQMEQITGKRFETIHVVGGGSQNELLCQMTADATNRMVVSGPVEATAAGNCLVQAMGQGEIGTLSELREVVRNSFNVAQLEPRPSTQWDERYQFFCKLIGESPS